jgi:hypothetical protein
LKVPKLIECNRTKRSLPYICPAIVKEQGYLMDLIKFIDAYIAVMGVVTVLVNLVLWVLNNDFIMFFIPEPPYILPLLIPFLELTLAFINFQVAVLKPTNLALRYSHRQMDTVYKTLCSS